MAPVISRSSAAAEAEMSIPSGSGDNSVWSDVSPLLQAACNGLKDGDLIHGDNFNLYAAMSALEIMDPKMDSGMISIYYSVDEAIDGGAAPVPISIDKTVDVECTIDIMDHLFACEATWHKGHSLAQTVFSCIYILRPERTTSHPLLHSYCRIIRATCKAVISVVSSARTHEEEDLFTMTYGLNLNDEDEKCLSMLNAVEETISRQLRACRAPSSGKKLHGDLEPLQNNPDSEEGYCRAILGRLRFRKHFYHTLMCLKHPQVRGLPLARKHIASCISELKAISKSSGQLSACRTTASGRQPVGFDSSLNARLSAPTPPRSINILSWNEAIEYFLKLLQDLDSISSCSLDKSLEGVLQFVVQVQNSQPDLVARAHLQHLLLQDGKLFGRDSIFSVITKAAELPESAKNNDIENMECMVQLGQLVINLLRILCTNSAWQRRKLGKILQDWRVIYIQNGRRACLFPFSWLMEEEKCRVGLLQFLIETREMMSNLLCSLFFNIEESAVPRSTKKCANTCRNNNWSDQQSYLLELALRSNLGETSGSPTDENLCTDILKQILMWVEEQAYWIASRFLMLGFELELYSLSEYCMVYWYIYVVSVKLVEKLHHRMSINNRVKYRGKKKRISGKDAPRDIQFPPPVLLLQSHICLAEGLATMLAAFRNEKMVLESPTPFNSDQERFLQHFELLLKAGIPDHISYQSFEGSIKNISFSALAMYNHFKDAQRMVKEVKGSFSDDPERQSELRMIEHVAEHNSIALNLLCRAGGGGGGSLDPSLKLSFEFSHHRHFATAVVRRS